jgi:hypothetical protein
MVIIITSTKIMADTRGSNQEITRHGSSLVMNNDDLTKYIMHNAFITHHHENKTVFQKKKNENKTVLVTV